MPRHLQPRAAAICLALALCLSSCGHAPSTAVTATATAAPTATPTAQPTPTLAPGTLQVSDPVAARALSFAFAQNNDVWVSLHGQPPQQMTHLGLGAQTLSWSFVWTADQTKLLAVADSGLQGQAWLITLANDVVVAMPSTLPTVDSAPSAWIGDRYIVYVCETGCPQSSHARAYNVYDTQMQRPLTTTLSGILATQMEVRGTSVYVSDYVSSDGPGPNVTPGIVRRWDLASNTLSTAFTVPVMLVSQGLPVGFWDLSADASRIVSASICSTPPAPSCSVYLQDTSGTTTIFRTQMPTGTVSISPDGTHAAGALSGSSGQPQAIVQQGLPTGPELTNALPGSCQNLWPGILGWSASPAGILLEADLTDASQNSIGVRICEAPVGTTQPARVVETIVANGQIAFAPPGS